MIIDKTLLDTVSDQAKASPRLRMNYNFHQSLDEKCHRFLNAVEPGTEVPIHKHPTKDETFVLLRGRVRVNTYNDDGTVLESADALKRLNTDSDPFLLWITGEAYNEN